ncbi:MAG: T9SS type A sorting domain-containing protein [Flavobacteriales bacterium]
MERSVRLGAMALALVVVALSAKAQSVTHYPTVAANIPSGNNKQWTDPGDVVSLYNGAATVNLGKNGVCNATKCFKSVALQATGFGFNLGVDDAVVGVEVTIRVKASMPNSVKDLSIQKFVWDGPVGTTLNKAKGSFIGTTYTLRTYGGPVDSWDSGLKWDWLTSPNYGVRISYKNLNTTSAATVSVDYVKVKVYYTNNMLLMSQEKNAAVVEEVSELYPDPATDELNLSVGSDMMDADVSILNLNGQVVHEARVAELVADEPLRLPLTGLSNGIYLLRVTSGTRSFSKRFVKEE